jgi:hypothetical protein
MQIPCEKTWAKLCTRAGNPIVVDNKHLTQGTLV